MNVYILRTAQEQYQGVRGRDGVSKDEFFVFPGVEGGTNFTMRGVPFPIEIGFWDRSGKLLEIKHMDAEIGGAKTPIGSFVAIEGAPDTLHNLSSMAVKSIIASVKGR
jgi:uncharacterized membrane protein (UPF0127 family)